MADQDVRSVHFSSEMVVELLTQAERRVIQDNLNRIVWSMMHNLCTTRWAQVTIEVVMYLAQRHPEGSGEYLSALIDALVQYDDPVVQAHLRGVVPCTSQER